MKKLLPLIALGLAGCGAGTSEQSVAADKDPTRSAVTAFLQKTLDDPASYAPASWGQPKALHQSELNEQEAERLNDRANVMSQLLKAEARNTSATGQQEFHKTELAAKRIQARQDSLLHAADTTTVGTAITHTYRAKNKMGALQLDSAHFVVYKSGRVEKR
jgi:hypothetical protein